MKMKDLDIFDGEVMECLDDDAPLLEGRFLVAARATVDAIFIFLIIFVNAFIIYVVLNRRGRFPEFALVSTRFAMNLALADLLVGLSAIAYLCTKYLCSVAIVFRQVKYACIIMFVLMIQAHVVSGYTILIIAIDRYIAVVHALRYRTVMNTRISRLMLVAVWLCGIILSTPLFFWNTWREQTGCDELLVFPVTYLPILCFPSLFLIAGTLSVVYCRIHKEAVASDERKRSRESGISSASSSSTDRERPPTLSPWRRRSARVLFLVTGCYVVCLMPITVVFVMRSGIGHSPALDILHNYCFTFLNMNYMLNPVLYSWMNTGVRVAILDVVYRIPCARRLLPSKYDTSLDEGRHRLHALANACFVT